MCIAGTAHGEQEVGVILVLLGALQAQLMESRRWGYTCASRCIAGTAHGEQKVGVYLCF